MAQGVEFDQRTNSFLSWFKSLEGASFSDAIQIVDLRSKNAGRGIGMLSRSWPKTKRTPTNIVHF